jgi:hypothetical protein
MLMWLCASAMGLSDPAVYANVLIEEVILESVTVLEGFSTVTTVHRCIPKHSCYGVPTRLLGDGVVSPPNLPAGKTIVFTHDLSSSYYYYYHL